MDDFPKILILGSLPYKKNAQSRAFDSYFHGWPKEKIRQFFSSPLEPTKGHCSQFYQMTDYRMLQKWFRSKQEVGKLFLDENVGEAGFDPLPASAQHMYKAGKKKTPFMRLARGLLWRKKFWCNRPFLSWVEEFSPDVLFLAWSDDFYLLRIAEYLSEKYSLPVISCVGDDYYFNGHFSLSPFYWWYRFSYKRLAKKVLTLPGSHVYIDEKIKDKYNAYFGIDGIVIHVACEQEMMPLRIPNGIHSAAYFGNVGYGRLDSLLMFAGIYGESHPEFRLHLYARNFDGQKLLRGENGKFVVLHEPLPYEQLAHEAKCYDAILVAESLNDKKFIRDVAYSLSTKIADSLSYGLPVIAIGNRACGAISFLRNKRCAFVLDSRQEVLEFAQMDLDKAECERMYERSVKVVRDEFSKAKSCLSFCELAKRVAR